MKIAAQINESNDEIDKNRIALKTKSRLAIPFPL